jgi:hypothetical protein
MDKRNEKDTDKQMNHISPNPITRRDKNFKPQKHCIKHFINTMKKFFFCIFVLVIQNHDYCLTPNEQFFSHIILRESYILMI